jgi:hypothetical protein
MGGPVRPAIAGDWQVRSAFGPVTLRLVQVLAEIFWRKNTHQRQLSHHKIVNYYLHSSIEPKPKSVPVPEPVPKSVPKPLPEPVQDDKSTKY